MTEHTEFNNKIIYLSTKDVIKVLQNKFGVKTPITVSMKRDGVIKKIELGIKLSTIDKKWITDKYSELST
tara:strand:- start:216 stop:425 length:210 start_codon:yes stop_codon:yes gene_type:complete